VDERVEIVKRAKDGLRVGRRTLGLQWRGYDHDSDLDLDHNVREDGTGGEIYGLDHEEAQVILDDPPVQIRLQLKLPSWP
jgi:hypothetical protein